MLRAHCREAFGGAAAREFVQRQRLADFHGFPQEALAKILQRLARTGLLLSHHGIKGGYTLARDPHQISVLDVMASDRRSAAGWHSRKTLAAPWSP